MANNKILIFLSNSYLLELNTEGELLKISKLISKIQSNPFLLRSNNLY